VHGFLEKEHNETGRMQTDKQTKQRSRNPHSQAPKHMNKPSHIHAAPWYLASRRTCLDECSALRLSASLSAIAFCAARTAADTGRDCDDDNSSDEDEEDAAMVADEDGRGANDDEEAA
jgi:hypothetical protein